MCESVVPICGFYHTVGGWGVNFFGTAVAPKYFIPLPLEGTTRIVVDEEVKAFVGKEATQSWHLRGAGVYNLRISRVSAATAHTEGSVVVSQSDTGEVLNGISSLHVCYSRQCICLVLHSASLIFLLF